MLTGKSIEPAAKCTTAKDNAGLGGEVEQQVVVVNAATLQDAYEFRRRLYADIGDEVPTRIQVEEALGDGEARICVFVSGGLFRDPSAKVFSAELEPAKAN